MSHFLPILFFLCLSHTIHTMDIAHQGNKLQAIPKALPKKMANLHTITMPIDYAYPRQIEEHTQFGAIQVYMLNNAIIATAHKASEQGAIISTFVEQCVKTGNFSSRSTFEEVPQSNRDLQSSPVMQHPPIIKYLKLLIAKYQMEHNIIIDSERATTPDPELTREAQDEFLP